MFVCTLCYIHNFHIIYIGISIDIYACIISKDIGINKKREICLHKQRIHKVVIDVKEQIWIIDTIEQISLTKVKYLWPSLNT